MRWQDCSTAAQFANDAKPQRCMHSSIDGKECILQGSASSWVRGLLTRTIDASMHRRIGGQWWITHVGDCDGCIIHYHVQAPQGRAPALHSYTVVTGEGLLSTESKGDKKVRTRPVRFPVSADSAGQPTAGEDGGSGRIHRPFDRAVHLRSRPERTESEAHIIHPLVTASVPLTVRERHQHQVRQAY